jgi:hypothetical protein
MQLVPLQLGKAAEAFMQFLKKTKVGLCTS